MENSEMSVNFSRYLLANRFRIYAIIFFALGVAAYLLFFYFDSKPKFMELPVFAISSSMFETKTFTFMKNNLTEELTGLLLLVGIYFLAMTKEKTEKPEYDLFRMNSLLLAFWLNFFFNIFGFIFFFGFSFFWIAFFNLYSIPLFYFCILRIKIIRNNNLNIN